MEGRARAIEFLQGIHRFEQLVLPLIARRHHAVDHGVVVEGVTLTEGSPAVHALTSVPGEDLSQIESIVLGAKQLLEGYYFTLREVFLVAHVDHLLQLLDSFVQRSELACLSYLVPDAVLFEPCLL